LGLIKQWEEFCIEGPVRGFTDRNSKWASKETMPTEAQDTQTLHRTTWKKKRKEQKEWSERGKLVI